MPRQRPSFAYLRALHRFDRVLQQRRRNHPFARNEIEPGGAIDGEAVAPQTDADVRLTADHRSGQGVDIPRRHARQIGVEQHEMVMGGGGYPPAQRIGLAAIGRVGNHLDARIGRQQRLGLVGRTIVHDDDFGQRRVPVHCIKNVSDTVFFIVRADHARNALAGLRGLLTSSIRGVGHHARIRPCLRRNYLTSPNKRANWREFPKVSLDSVCPTPRRAARPSLRRRHFPCRGVGRR